VLEERRLRLMEFIQIELELSKQAHKNICVNVASMEIKIG
jgi:hypothetical protein